MANNKTTNQPGSNDKQPHAERTRNQEAHDTSKNRPNAERTMIKDSNKTKQGQEDNHKGKSKGELVNERGGHGHSGHSSNRSGSDSNA